MTRYYFSIRIAMGVRAFDPPEAPDRFFIYAVGLDEVVIDVKELDASKYIRASDGRIQVQLRRTAAELLFGGSFDTWVDHVRVVVRE